VDLKAPPQGLVGSLGSPPDARQKPAFSFRRQPKAPHLPRRWRSSHIWRGPALAKRGQGSKTGAAGRHIGLPPENASSVARRSRRLFVEMD
jgi:hypothetical protein